MKKENESALDSKNTYLFVYGTLMRGCRAENMLNSASYIGDACLRGYSLYDLGSYPAIIPSHDGMVFGELYCAPESILPSLDQYEGEGVLYRRTELPVEADKTYKALAYVYAHPGELLDRPLVEGKWHQPWDEVWYAAYGSNLSAERFTCYIRGGVAANGKKYDGFTDRRLWTEDRIIQLPGRMYFAQSSGSWGGKGVAFFDPSGRDSVWMRLYQIRWNQLLELQDWEGTSPNWYGRIVPLGVLDGLPIFTLSSKNVQAPNPPSDEYLSLIRSALISECGLDSPAAALYLKACLISS